MSEREQRGGINVGSVGRDLTIEAGGDVVAGDKIIVQQIVNWAKVPSNPKVPYKFLSYYTIEDRDFFFGRRDDITRIVGHLSSFDLVFLSGPSGCGKTSLVNAGLIPAVSDGDYFFLAFRDYNQPDTVLRHALAPDLRLTLQSAGGESFAIERQASRLVVIFDQFERFLLSVSPEGRNRFLALVADQLRERTAKVLFSVREDFLGQLLAEFQIPFPDAFRQGGFYALQPLSKQGAREAILLPLKDTPKIGYDDSFVENELIPSLISSTSAVNSVPPVHLQIVCNQLYALATEQLVASGHGQPVIIGDAMYRAIGGVKGILRDYFNQAIERVVTAPADIADARSVLKTMIGSRGTRKFMTATEIAWELSYLPEAKIESIVSQLLEARLLEGRKAEGQPSIRYAPSSEYVVPEILSWYDESEIQKKKSRETLERGLEEYLSNGSILNRTQISLVQRWLAPSSLTPDETQLIATSDAAVNEAEQAETERSALLASRKTLISRLLIGVVVVSVGFGAWATYEARRAGQQAAAAEHQADIARTATEKSQASEKQAIDETRKTQEALIRVVSERARNLAGQSLQETASGDAMTGVILGLIALQGVHQLEGTTVPSELRTALYKAVINNREEQVVAQSQGGVPYVDRAGDRIITRNSNDSAEVWDITGPAPILLGELDTVVMSDASSDLFSRGLFKISPDGRWLAMQGRRGSALHLQWLGEIGAKSVSKLPSAIVPSASPSSAGFSPDGRLLIVVNPDEDFEFFDVSTSDVKHMETFKQVHRNQVARNLDIIWGFNGAMDEQGQHIAVAQPDGIQTIDRSSTKVGTSWMPFKAGGFSTAHLAVSPDGSLVAAGDQDGRVTVWTWSNSRLSQPRTFQGLQEIAGLLFSPNGRSLAARDRNGGIKVWDIADTGELQVSLSKDGKIYDFSFSGDSRQLAVSSGEGLIDILAVQDRQRIFPITLQGHVAPAGDLTFTGMPPKLVSVSGDGTVRTWNVSAGTAISPRFGVLRPDRFDTGDRDYLKFDPGGNFALFSPRWGPIELWDMRARVPLLVQTLDHVVNITGYEREVAALSFSDDGSRINVAFAGGLVKEWRRQGTSFVRSSDLRFPGLNGLNSLHEIDFSPDLSKISVVDSLTGYVLQRQSDLSFQSILDLGATDNLVFASNGSFVGSRFDEVFVDTYRQDQTVFRADTTAVRKLGEAPRLDRPFDLFTSKSPMKVAGVFPGGVRIINFNEGEEALSVPFGSGEEATVGAISADGVAVVAGGKRESGGAVLRQRALEGDEHVMAADLRVSGQSITGLAFSPDSGQLLAVSDHGLLQLWPRFKSFTDLVRQACRIVRRHLTIEQRAKYGLLDEEGNNETGQNPGTVSNGDGKLAHDSLVQFGPDHEVELICNALSP